jgi:hypothetical protein
MVSKRSKHTRRQGHPPCPHCDQPDTSLLRLVLIGEILRADEPLLAFLVEVMQQAGQLHFAEELPMPPVRRRKGTLHRLRPSHTDRS